VSSNPKALKLNDLEKLAKAQYKDAVTTDGELDALPNTNILITYFKRDVSGSLTLLTSGATLGVGDYRVVLQWVRYISVTTDDNRTIYYGVGGRASGDLTVKTAGLKALIGSLFFGANASQTNGKVDVTQFGVAGAPVDNLVTIGSVDLSQENIGQMMVQFANLFSKLREKGVKIRPQLIAVDLRTAQDLGIVKADNKGKG
jgi:hypothetical protein